MRLTRPRLSLRQMMAFVAVAALVSLVASNPDRHNGVTDRWVVIPVASAVAAAYGVGAIRRPLAFLAPLIAAWIAMPAVDHPAPDLINVSAGGCYLAWIIEAPTGLICRSLASLAIDPPEPK